MTRLAAALAALALLAAGPSASAREPATPVHLDCGPPPGAVPSPGACLQAEIDRVCAGAPESSVLLLPAGTFPVDAITVPCGGVAIVGQGPGDDVRGTTLVLGPGDRDGIRFGPAGGEARIRGARLSGMRIDGRNRTGGAAIAMEMVEHGSVEDVVLRDVHDGLRFGPGIHLGARNLYLDQVRHTGIVLGGSYPESCSRSGNIANCPFRQDVVALEDIFMGSAGGHEAAMTGIHWQDFSATLNLRNVQVVNPNIGIRVECRTGAMDACPHFFNGWNLEVDFAVSQAVRASDFQEWKCFNCYFNGRDSGTGPLLAFFNERLPGSSGVQLVGGKALGSGGSLIDLAVRNARVSDMDLYNGSLAEPGRSPAIRILPSAGEDTGLVAIRGNTFCTFGATAPSLMGGVSAEPGASRILVTGNLFYGCAFGWDGPGAGEALVTNNLGP